MGDDARIEARGSKNDARAFRFNPRVSTRCASACAASTSFDNDKGHFQLNDTGFATLTFRLLFSDQVNGSPITSSLEPEKKFQGFQAEALRSKQPRIACKAP